MWLRSPISCWHITAWNMKRWPLVSKVFYMINKMRHRWFTWRFGISLLVINSISPRAHVLFYIYCVTVTCISKHWSWIRCQPCQRVGWGKWKNINIPQDTQSVHNRTPWRGVHAKVAPSPAEENKIVTLKIKKDETHLNCLTLFRYKGKNDLDLN